MPVRIVEGQLPYTGGTGIEIDANKVISLLLREENNLIMVNDNNEVYTDLQLESGLTPSSDFPVGVTVGKVLQADGWTKSGLVLNRKTTSGDYARWIYATDGEIYFDNGTGTWKQVYYSSEVDALFAQLRSELATVAFTGDYDDLINKPVDDTMYGSSWDGETEKAPSQNAVYDKINSIDSLISTNATSTNKLMDKNYIDDGINSVTAYYITKNAQGDQFATHAELASATTFYSGGVVRVPTRNDYTIVLDDETHNDEVTRYIYNNGWEYQYTINESPMTQAQLNALNSGITSTKVGQYDTAVSTIAGYGDIVTHDVSEFATATQGGKADTALQPNDDISELNNDVGYVTASIIDDTAYGNGWDGDTTHAPTKNAVYDKINTMDGTISGKQDTLVSGTNIKSVNGNSLLGSGNLVLHSGTTASLTVNGWSSNTQTVTVSGVTASNYVIVSPAPASITDYTDSKIYCSAQGSNSLTFTCDTVPSNTITVNVVILN